MSETPLTATCFTFADLATEFERVGLTLSDVAEATLSDVAPARIDGPRGHADGQLWLELSVYLRDGEGRRYLDDHTGEVAKESVRYPLAALRLADPEP